MSKHPDDIEVDEIQFVVMAGRLEADSCHSAQRIALDRALRQIVANRVEPEPEHARANRYLAAIGSVAVAATLVLVFTVIGLRSPQLKPKGEESAYAVSHVADSTALPFTLVAARSGVFTSERELSDSGFALRLESPMRLTTSGGRVTVSREYVSSPRLIVTKAQTEPSDSM